MVISLSEIIIKQEQLDRLIYENNNVQIEDIKEELLLATFVELSEFCNEVRSFKFWSKKGMNNKKIVIEEYADGIHFLATFINYFKIDPVFNISNLQIILDKRIITIEFNELFKLLAKIDFSNEKEVNASIFQKYIKKYILLGLGLNFSFNEILEAYNNKYKINIKRQKSGTY